MQCPHCGSEHNRDEDGRFCNSCGMSVVQFVKTDDEPTDGELQEGVSCGFCGTPAQPPRCPACGSRVSAPDGWEE